ncbi:MAG TPA: START-like domain-containing protein, partial [Flavobacteriales bacterium]|nr:START-like domain-containing protein [Flavobacteriales bacterium]
KAPVKKAPAKKAPAKKATVKKAPAQKAPAKTVPSVAQLPKKEAAPVRPPKSALKQRYQLEFYLNASVASLYEHISTPSGFSKWFCDDVNVIDSMYTFKWGEDTEVAECLNQRSGEYIRFRWADDMDEDPNAYFELRIRIDGMTNETCLVVTDHAWPRDLEEEKALWESQIHTLTRVLGA